MKIGYFITQFPYKNKNVNEKYIIRGAEVVADNLANSMSDKGHEVSIFTTSAFYKSEIEQYGKIKIYRYGTGFKMASGRFSLGLLKNPSDFSLDIIHVHFSVPMGDFAGYQYAKKKKKPLIVTYHGDLQENMGGILKQTVVKFYNKHFLKKILSYADKIISPSEHYILESRFLGNYRDKIIAIPNGIHIKNFEINYSKNECRTQLGLPIDKKIILFVGTLISHKGPDILIKALPKIIKQIPNVHILFVGDGPMRHDLEILSRKLHVEANIMFAGFVPEYLTPYYYKCADVFCLPSYLESFGIVLLEASSCNLPLVVSDLKSFKSIVENGVNGIFTKKGDVEDLSNAIIFLFENNLIREQMGINARKKIDDFSWDKITEKTEEVYRSVLL